MINNNCRIRTNNTAPSRCSIDLGLYRKVLVIPKTAYYTELDAQGQPQTFAEWIDNGIHAAKPENRFYPMPNFENCEDNTEDRVVYTSGYGTTTPLRDGNFAFTQNFRPDSCLNKKLLAFNNQSFRVIIFDNENNAQVIRTAKGITGSLANIYISQPKANTATEISEPQIVYSFLDSNEQRLREVIPTDLTWGELKGLEDFQMNVIKDGANYIITFTVACSGDDVTGEIRQLSTVSNAWLQQTGTAAPVPMTNVPTFDAVKGVFTVTGLSAGTKIGLANPFVLFQNNVSNVDCPDMVVVPA